MKYANTESSKNYNAKYFSGHIAGVAKNIIIDEGDVCLADLVAEFGITEAEAQKAKDEAIGFIKHDLWAEYFWNCPAMAAMKKEQA